MPFGCYGFRLGGADPPTDLTVEGTQDSATADRSKWPIGPAAASISLVRAGALLLQGTALVLLAHTLGVHDFGVFSLVLLVQSLIAVVSNLGILTSSQYQIGRRELSVEHVAAASLVATAIGCVLLVPPSSFMLSSLYAVALADLPVNLFVLGILAGPIRLCYEAMLGVFIGTGDLRGQSLVAAAGPATLMVLLLVLKFTVGLSLPIAVFAWLGSQVAVLAVALLRLRRHGRLLAPSQTIERGRVWAVFLQLGLGAYASYVMYWASMRLDRVGLSVVGGAEAVGLFSLAAWVAESFALLPMAVGSVLFPRLAVDPRSQVATYLPAATRTVLAAAAALSIPTLFVFGIVSHALGGILVSALPVLVLILPGYLAFGLFGIFISYWIAERRTATPAVFYTAAAIGRTIVILLLFEPLGIAGVAAATSVVSALIAFVAAASIARDLGIPTSALLVPQATDARRAFTVSLRAVGRLRSARMQP